MIIGNVNDYRLEKARRNPVGDKGLDTMSENGYHEGGDSAGEADVTGTHNHSVMRGPERAASECRQLRGRNRIAPQIVTLTQAGMKISDVRRQLLGAYTHTALSN